MTLTECPVCHRYTALLHEMRRELCIPLSPIIAEIVALGEASHWRRQRAA